MSTSPALRSTPRPSTYYPAEIYRVNSTDGKIILNSLEGTDKKGFNWGPASTSDEFSATGFEEDEIVYYTYAKEKIQSVAKAEFIEGDVTKVVANTEDTDGQNFSVDTTNYKYNMTMKTNRLITENVDNNMSGYLDANGYCIYIDKAAVTYDYAYVLSIGNDGGKADSTQINSTVRTRLLLTDGTIVTVETDVKNSNKEAFKNHIVSYSKNSAGVYTLALKDNYVAKSTDGTDGIKPTTAANLDVFENGKSTVYPHVSGEDTYVANNNTVVLAVDTNGSQYFVDWSYTVYTGIKNIPDIKTLTGTKICVAANENRVAKVIYAENADVSGNGEAVFVAANGGNNLTLVSGATKYYELTSYVNGVSEKIKVKKDSEADTTLIHFNKANPPWKAVAVKTSGDKWVVPIRSMSVDNDGLVTSVRVHDLYGGPAGVTGSKAISGSVTGRDRTTGNEVIYLGTTARSWLDDAKLVQYSVKNDAWTADVRISNTSVKDDPNDEWVVILDDGEVVGLFIKDIENGAGSGTGSQTVKGEIDTILTGDGTNGSKAVVTTATVGSNGRLNFNLQYTAPKFAKPNGTVDLTVDVMEDGDWYDTFTFTGELLSAGKVNLRDRSITYVGDKELTFEITAEEVSDVLVKYVDKDSKPIDDLMFSTSTKDVPVTGSAMAATDLKAALDSAKKTGTATVVDVTGVTAGASAATFSSITTTLANVYATRRCLKNGNMPNGEEFFCQANTIFRRNTGCISRKIGEA